MKADVEQANGSSRWRWVVATALTASISLNVGLVVRGAHLAELRADIERLNTAVNHRIDEERLARIEGQNANAVRLVLLEREVFGARR